MTETIEMVPYFLKCVLCMETYADDNSDDGVAAWGPNDIHVEGVKFALGNLEVLCTYVCM